MKEFEKAIQSYADAVTTERPEDAQTAAMQALLLAAEESLKNPTPSILLKHKAGACEEKGDWVGAEAAYREVLALEESLGNAAAISHAHMELSRLLRWLGRSDEAWQSARHATAAARRTDMFTVLVMALINESHRALDKEDYTQAMAAASEALQVVESGKIFDLLRAKSQIARAKCLLATGDPAGADTNLASSWETLKRHPASMLMQGVTQAHASWWEVKSQLEEHRGNVSGAIEAMDAAIGHHRQLEGPYALFALAAALSNSACNSPEAERAAAEAKGIRIDLRVPNGR
jgi:tetratricopeptide (TPR) repeat protein